MSTWLCTKRTGHPSGRSPGDEPPGVNALTFAPGLWAAAASVWPLRATGRGSAFSGSQALANARLQMPSDDISDIVYDIQAPGEQVEDGRDASLELAEETAALREQVWSMQQLQAQAPLQVPPSTSACVGHLFAHIRSTGLVIKIRLIAAKSESAVAGNE